VQVSADRIAESRARSFLVFEYCIPRFPSYCKRLSPLRFHFLGPIFFPVCALGLLLVPLLKLATVYGYLDRDMLVDAMAITLRIFHVVSSRVVRQSFKFFFFSRSWGA